MGWRLLHSVQFLFLRPLWERRGRQVVQNTVQHIAVLFLGELDCQQVVIFFVHSVLLSVLMGLVVFGLVGLLRGLCSADRLLELGCDGGPGCPVRVAGSRAQLIVLHLLFRQGLQIGQFAPCPHGAALHHTPLVKVDDLHGSVAARLQEGAEVNGPLGRVIAVILCLFVNGERLRMI